MENLAPAEPRARARLTDDQAQELVLRTVATQAESLLRTAYRHSLCDDDAHDAYQRGMEIFLRRAPTLDPTTATRWLHVVIKHEAMAVKRGRVDVVAAEDLNYDRHDSPHEPSPEERALTVDRTTRAAEALRRLKPQELRAMWLKAMGHSYAEIGEITGFSATKVNRCLAEGRKSFLERFEGIEAGAECERWQSVLSAMADGEATAAQITEARPHLRNCPACRSTLAGLGQSRRPLAAVLPVGLVGAMCARLSGLMERLIPAMSSGGGGGGDAVATGAGVLGVGGMKLAGIVAAGAVATAGGGMVVEHEVRGSAKSRSAEQAVTAKKPVAAASRAATPPTAVSRAAAAPQASATSKLPQASSGARRPTAKRLTARRRADARGIEFAPGGVESAGAPVSRAAAADGDAAAGSPPATTSREPTPAPPTAPDASPTPSPADDTADSTRGEFAPQP